MKKQQHQTYIDPEVIYRKNRGRLIQQNKQLYFQIYRLQSKVNTVITKNIANEFKETVQQQKTTQKHKQETKDQIVQIQKLKKKILLIKNATKPQQKQDMRQALDDLTFMKRQKQKYLLQKQALLRKKGLKNQALQLNKPMQQERNRVKLQYQETLRQNFQFKNKITKLERQIVNFHKTKELAKTSVPKVIQNHALQISKIETQIIKLKAQINAVQKQGQPQIDSLTNEYFILKQIKISKQDEFLNLDKSLNTYKNRILAMKQQEKILQDRARISQIIISPKKRDEILAIYQNQKQKQKYFERFKTSSKTQTAKFLKQSKLRAEEIKNQKMENYRTSQFNHNKQLENISHVIESQQNNQFASPEEILHQINQNKSTKQNRIFQSVAVGTTFYYNDNEEEEHQNQLLS